MSSHIRNSSAQVYDAFPSVWRRTRTYSVTCPSLDPRISLSFDDNFIFSSFFCDCFCSVAHGTEQNTATKIIEALGSGLEISWPTATAMITITVRPPALAGWIRICDLVWSEKMIQKELYWTGLHSTVLKVL